MNAIAGMITKSRAYRTKVAPKKIQEEWELFEEEVLREVDRLENESETTEPSKNKGVDNSESKDLEVKVKEIRTKVAALNSMLEGLD